jgi:hypothetical protein
MDSFTVSWPTLASIRPTDKLPWSHFNPIQAFLDCVSAKVERIKLQLARVK